MSGFLLGMKKMNIKKQMHYYELIRYCPYCGNLNKKPITYRGSLNMCRRCSFDFYTCPICRFRYHVSIPDSILGENCTFNENIILKDMNS